MDDSPEKRLARVFRERRRLRERWRRGEISRDEYLAAFRKMVKEARLNEPNLARPWWADNLGWLARSLAQAVYSGVLREGEHVAFLRREGAALRRAFLDDCACLAVHLASALPALAPYGFDLPRADVDRALATAAGEQPDLVARTRMRIGRQGARDRLVTVVLFDWARLQELGKPPRRGDPRGP